MKPHNVIILNEAKGNVALYHIRVEVSGVPLWTGVYAESVERANRIAEKVYGKGSVRGRPTKVKESVEESKGPKKGVDKGSQKRYKHPMATDNPDKYVGKWEAYDEPQGIGTKAANVTMKPPTNEAAFNLDDAVPYKWENDIAYFNVGGAPFLATISGGEFSFFHTGKEWTPKNVNPAMIRSIMATLVNILKDILTYQKPKEVTFTGGDPTRERMFKRLVGAFSNMLPPDYEIDLTDGWWVIKRKDSISEDTRSRGSVVWKPGQEELPDVKTYSPKEIAAHHGVDLESILRELRMGIQVELEHTKDKALSQEIALDHLLELPDYYTRLERMERVKEGSLGPEFSRGLTNSSTGRGAVPPPTDFDPKELPNTLRPAKRHPGAKAPVKKAMRDAAKQNTDKVRKPNSPVTEHRLDELFGGGQTLPYRESMGGVAYFIPVGDETQVIVGFEPYIEMYIPGAEPGINVGFATEHQGQMLHGVDRENLGVDRGTLIALFNTIIKIVTEWAARNQPDRAYFIAVEPMKAMYPKLLKRFVDSNEYNVTKSREMIVPLRTELDVYMVEKRGMRESKEPIKEIIGPRGNKYPYDYRGTDAWSEIDLGDGITVGVGLMDINSMIPNMEPGYNVGFLTEKDGRTHYSIDLADLGLNASETIALFNTIIEILQRLEREAKPNVVYFIAVEPMKNIYPRLLRKFADPNVWKTEKGRYHVPMVGGQLDVYKLTRRGYMDEMVRLPIQTKFNADYEIKDGEKTVGVATVNDGVIEKLMINQEAADEDFKGHALSTTLGTIVRDADLQNANLAMQVVDLEDQEMKRFLERFGFRHTGEGIFKRTAGSIAPPSVIEDK